MKKYIYCLLLTLILAIPALAVPEYINYQGLLRDGDGDLVTGTRSMTFGIYSSQTGGTALWTMTASSVSINNGLYTVQLGPLTGEVLGAGRRWLQVTIGSETLSPRLELLSVAYAVTADTATTALYAVSAESASKLQNYVPVVSGTGSFIPVAVSGKLSTSVIPTSGLLADTADYANVSGTATHAATADYATVSGTATNAANADTVDSLDANSTPTADTLYPLDGSGRLSGVPVSAEQGSDTYALSITGALKASGCVGQATITAGLDDVIINNSNVTTNSLIITTISDDTDFSPAQEVLQVHTVGTGSFHVKVMDGDTSTPITFNYLIIN